MYVHLSVSFHLTLIFRGKKCWEPGLFYPFHKQLRTSRQAFVTNFFIFYFWRTHVLGPLIPLFLDFWWHLSWVSKLEWVSLAHFLACIPLLRFTSFATPANLLTFSMVTNHISYMHLSAEVGYQGLNRWSLIQCTDTLPTQPLRQAAFVTNMKSNLNWPFLKVEQAQSLSWGAHVMLGNVLAVLK